MTDKPWTVNRLIGEMNQWDCHQSDSCDCPHQYCDTLCSGKVADQCQAETDEADNVDIPGCHPDTCGQAQLDALLAVVQAMLQVPGARRAAEEALAKHLGDDG